jgi:hypothetical protein
MEIETGGCGVYRGIRGLGVSMNRRNERRVTIVDRSGGRVDQTITSLDYLLTSDFNHFPLFDALLEYGHSRESKYHPQ